MYRSTGTLVKRESTSREAIILNSAAVILKDLQEICGGLEAIPGWDVGFQEG